MSAGWYLQKAIAAKLAAYASTSGYTVSDNIDAEPPVIVIGQASPARQVRHTSGELYDEVAQIDIYTFNATGAKESREMMEDVKDALNDAVLDLSADSYKALAKPTKVFETVLVELDGAGRELRHAIGRFRFFTVKT